MAKFGDPLFNDPFSERLSISMAYLVTTYPHAQKVLNEWTLVFLSALNNVIGNNFHRIKYLLC